MSLKLYTPFVKEGDTGVGGVNCNVPIAIVDGMVSVQLLPELS